jgi:phospholipid/cholesterol/gamma-HCH transport system substrate-binding protein
MTKEAKVGLFTIAGAALLLFVILHLSGIHFGGDKDYTVYVGFNKAIALNPEAEVRYAGIPAGHVKSVTPEGNGVRVEMKLKPSIKVPEDAVITIDMAGVMGDKFISILPEGSKSKEYLKDGDYVIGRDEQGMGSVMAEAAQAIAQMHDLLASLNDVFGNPAMKDAMLQTAENIRGLTDNIREQTAVFRRVAVRNEGQIDAMVAHLSGAASNVDHMMAEMDALVTDFSGDGETAANLRLAVVNLTKSSEDIQASAESVREMVTDPQKKAELDTIIHNASEMSSKGNAMLGSLHKIKISPAVEELYSGSKGGWMTDASLDVSTGTGSYLTMGIDDIGDNDWKNFEVGRRNGSFGGRAGIIDSKPGIGLDAYAGSRWKFSADAYDIDDIDVKLRAQYQLTDDTAFVGQWNHVNHADDRAAYIGLRQSF